MRRNRASSIGRAGVRCATSLLICQELGLKVLVRSGPWSHGEARNGGFPDWVQNSGLPLRTNNPEYMKLVKSYWTQLMAQMRGLLWKDGGPVIGIQLDNECADVPYLFALKRWLDHWAWTCLSTP